MTEGVAARAQLGLDLRAVGAGAEGGDAAVLVQVEQLVHALQRQGQHRPRRGGRVDVSGHRGAAAVGNDDGVPLPCPGQQLANLRRGLRQGHGVGKHAEAAGAHGQPVRQALAAGVAHARLGLAGDQRVLGQARCRHLGKHLGEAGIGQRPARAEAFGEKGRALFRQMYLGTLVTPAIPAPHALPPCRSRVSAAYTSQPRVAVTVRSGHAHSPIEPKTRLACRHSAIRRFPSCSST